MTLPNFRLAAAVAIATVFAAGCGWRPKHASSVEKTAVFQPDYHWGERVPQPETPAEVVPASAVDDVPNVDTFTITFRAIDFTLPASRITDIPERVVASQSVTIVTDERVDADGLLEGS